MFGDGVTQATIDEAGGLVEFAKRCATYDCICRLSAHETACDYCGERDLVGSGHEVGEPCPTGSCMACEAREYLLERYRPTARRGALMSDDRTHRYLLWRTWGPPTGPRAVVIGLNPSTADEFTDDQTIRRCRSMAMAWGCSGLDMVNLYSLRSREPAAVWEAGDSAIGPECDDAIRAAIRSPQMRVTIAAWGSFPKATHRMHEVCRLVHSAGVQLCVLGTNRDGSPTHPARRDLPRAVWPHPWRPGLTAEVKPWTSDDVWPGDQRLQHEIPLPFNKA